MGGGAGGGEMGGGREMGLGHGRAAHPLSQLEATSPGPAPANRI